MTGKFDGYSKQQLQAMLEKYADRPLRLYFERFVDEVIEDWIKGAPTEEQKEAERLAMKHIAKKLQSKYIQLREMH